jgi:hypothetical protein
MNDRPPDDWGDPVNSGQAGEDADLLRQAAALREAWIAGVRAHVSRQTGRPCYYNSKPSFDGGFCRESRRTYKPVWPKLVERARREGLDPIRLVTVLFAAWGTSESPRPTHDLFTAQNIARYTNHVRNMEYRTRLAFNTEQTIYKSAVHAATQTIPDPDEAVRFVLNDASRRITPLFRYSIAVIKNLTDVADRWRDLATHQAAQAPEGYLAAWANIIPQDIAAVAKAAAGKVA